MVVVVVVVIIIIIIIIIITTPTVRVAQRPQRHEATSPFPILSPSFRLRSRSFPLPCPSLSSFFPSPLEEGPLKSS